MKENDLCFSSSSRSKETLSFVSFLWVSWAQQSEKSLSLCGLESSCEKGFLPKRRSFSGRVWTRKQWTGCWSISSLTLTLWWHLPSAFSSTLILIPYCCSKIKIFDLSSSRSFRRLLYSFMKSFSALKDCTHFKESYSGDQTTLFLNLIGFPRSMVLDLFFLQALRLIRDIFSPGFSIL